VGFGVRPFERFSTIHANTIHAIEVANELIDAPKMNQKRLML
jgi:hypothetical protein